MSDTTSQAEAQAPTTAAQASVLTDADEMFIRCYLYDSVATFNTYADLHRAKGTPEADEKARRNDDMAKRGYEAFRKHMARLTSTVRAPAPDEVLTAYDALLDELARYKASRNSWKERCHYLESSTVGAPAPAPTMPTREQQLETALRDLLGMAECWETVTDGKQFRLEDSDTVKRALALIAKGDTP